MILVSRYLYIQRRLMYHVILELLDFRMIYIKGTN